MPPNDDDWKITTLDENWRQPWFSNMIAQCIAPFLGLPTIFSKRDRSHCDFSCLLRLVVRGLIFLLSGRVSGPISLLSGRASQHHLKRPYKMPLHMEGQTDLMIERPLKQKKRRKTLIFLNMIAECIAVFLGFAKLYSKRDRSHCDFSCLR